MSRRSFVAGMVAAAGVGGFKLPAAAAQDQQPSAILFDGVRIFDGQSDQLQPPSNVLIEGNLIKTISAAPISVAPDRPVTRIQVPKTALMTADIEFVTVAAVRGASDMLMRGFTSVRDMGGPVFGLKRGIDSGLAVGPRIKAQWRGVGESQTKRPPTSRPLTRSFFGIGRHPEYRDRA